MPFVRWDLFGRRLFHGGSSGSGTSISPAAELAAAGMRQRAGRDPAHRRRRRVRWRVGRPRVGHSRQLRPWTGTGGRRLEIDHDQRTVRRPVQPIRPSLQPHLTGRQAAVLGALDGRHPRRQFHLRSRQLAVNRQVGRSRPRLRSASTPARGGSWPAATAELGLQGQESLHFAQQFGSADALGKPVDQRMHDDAFDLLLAGAAPSARGARAPPAGHRRSGSPLPTGRRRRPPRPESAAGRWTDRPARTNRADAHPPRRQQPAGPTAALPAALISSGAESSVTTRRNSATRSVRCSDRRCPPSRSAGQPAGNSSSVPASSCRKRDGTVS